MSYITKIHLKVMHFEVRRDFPTETVFKTVSQQSIKAYLTCNGRKGNWPLGHQLGAW